MAKKDLYDTSLDQFDTLSSGGEASPDDLDVFLAGLNLDFSSGPQSGSTMGTSAPETAFPSEEDPPSRKIKRRRSAEEEAPEEDFPQERGGFILRHRRVINLILLLICLGLVAGIAAVILLQSIADPLDGKIVENVYVAGVDVSGMSKEEALSAVNAAIANRYTEETMVVELGSIQLVLSPDRARPALNVQSVVNAAFSFGRTGSSSQRQKDYRKAQNGPVEISGEQYLSVDTEYVRSTVSDFIKSVSGEYSPSGYFLEGERPALDADGFDQAAPRQTLVLEMGTPGGTFDLNGICAAIYKGYSLNNFHVIIPRECLPQFPEKLDIDAIYQQLHVNAVEAVENGGQFIPGSCGYTFDLEKARAQLSAASYGQTLSIPMEYVIPSKLDSNGTFTEILSTYSTPVSSNEVYNQNMKLLCRKLNGLVLEPGEAFSFNLFFKEHSEQDGYQKAPRHGDCCMEEEVCGGMDQVATTLYVAAKTADLTVLEKHMADHLCSYTTKGTELTVSSGRQELKLSNALNYPVKIRARVTDKQVTIQFLSEQAPATYIKLETKEGYSIGHGTSFAAKKAADGFTNGQVLVEGVDGCQVTLQWVKYDKATNAEISRTSEYLESRPMNTVLVNIVG